MDYPFVEHFNQTHSPPRVVSLSIEPIPSKPRLSPRADLRITRLDISAVGLDEAAGGLGG